MKQKHNRLWAWLAAGALLLTGCSAAPVQQEKPADPGKSNQADRNTAQNTPAADGENEEFTAYTKEYVEKVCENSYILMHQYFEDPGKYGIDAAKADISLGTLLPDDEDIELENELANRLDTFDPADLDATQQVIYQSLKFDFDNSDELYDKRFYYLDQIWNEYNSPADSLVQMFSEYQVRQEADIAPLLTLIGDVPRFVDDCMGYTKNQADRHLLMMDYEGVAEKCQDVVKAGKDSAVSANLHRQIEALDLGEDKTKSCLDQVDKALADSFYPQFQRIIDELKPYQDKAIEVTGLANLENGREYYAALAKDATGTADTPDQMEKNLQEMIASLSLQMQTMMRKDPDAVEEATNLHTGFESVDDIMAFLEENYTRDFPGVGKMNFEVQPLSKEQANPGVMAYFMIPPVDNTAPYRIRFNAVDYGSDTTDVELYDTLAHEGIPGHMYQTQYDHETFQYPIQYLLSSSGFTEGYATYVECQSNKWLDASENAVKFYNWMKMLSNSYIALMDLSVNWDGMSLEEFNDEYGPVFGSEDMSGLYKQLSCCPAQFQSYYYGNYVIMTMRNNAQKELGKSFDSKAFNQALLENGSVPFAVVEKSVQTYVDSAKG